MSNPYFRTQDEVCRYSIHQLFQYYNSFFFQGLLCKCTVEWSHKMTLTAGACQNKGFQSCSIRLSEPILKYRDSNELKQTLLHEMIHAYLFITNPASCLRNQGHGPEFQAIMKNINNITQLNITVYHNFFNEVNFYRSHIWRCNGKCRQRAPYYGYVQRSMNRKPQPADRWYSQHQASCGGQFIKISGPEKAPKSKSHKIQKRQKTKQKKMKTKQKRNWGSGKTIQQYVREMQANKPENINRQQNQQDIKQNPKQSSLVEIYNIDSQKEEFFWQQYEK